LGGKGAESQIGMKSELGISIPDVQPVDAQPGRARGGVRIAVIVPCFNEEAAIHQVIADFRVALPQATVYVYDNNSTDRTPDVARAAGAVVRRETHQGKGNVVRRMFADVDADIYVLVDGDATYDAVSAPAMIARLLDDRLDMVVAARRQVEDAAYRPGHLTGNRMLTWFVATVFGRAFTDILSGYRVFSRRFVKSWLRDRDRADGAFTGAGIGGRGNRDSLLRSA
jgi:glycosyltransferase involved in cell wall biosynthesis